MKLKLTFILILSIVFVNTNAQGVLLLKQKIADKYFKNMAYIQAIATYEDILREDSGNTSVFPNLAISYRKINDTYNAERIYARLAVMDTSNATYALAYAQLLAINKRYNESAKMYQRYAYLNPLDTRGAKFAEAYQEQSLLTKESKVKVEIANFNSGQSDFSPAFYKKGLVFVSNRNYSTSVKRTFEWDQSSFLNLYYIPDTASIKKVNKTDTAEGTSKRRKIYYNDDDTRSTSNDSRTMGAISYKYADTSSMFVTPEVVVTDFSKSIKTKYHEGPMTFSADQKNIIFTRNNYNKGKARKSDEGINKLKLYSARINNDGEWVNIAPLNINNNNLSIGHPALGPGDTILYYVSDMPGGFGGTDLYKSYLIQGQWSTPQNLGPRINTAGNEQFPYLDKEGVLYFSSDGHPGLGGLDIFKVLSLDKPVIENMGIPVNSNYDDFGIAIDETGTQGFFSSNRRRGVNDDDIYKIYVEKPSKFIIRVVDSLTRELISFSEIKVNETNGQTIQVDTSKTGAFIALLWDQGSYTIRAISTAYQQKTITITADLKTPVIEVPLVKYKEGCILAGNITEKESNAPVSSALITIINKLNGDTAFNVLTDSNGNYRVIGLKGNSDYLFYVSKKNYFTKPPQSFSTKGVNCLINEVLAFDHLNNFVLERIVVGKAIKIENIYFDLAKYNIRKDAARELDKIVKLMQDNPDIIIELSSHTDCRASFKYNMTLSDNRAKSSAAYIISKGIAPNRITGKGYGETQLVNDCACEGQVVSRTCSEEEHQANRRTEFKVTGFLSDNNTKILNDGKGNTPASAPLPRNQ